MSKLFRRVVNSYLKAVSLVLFFHCSALAVLVLLPTPASAHPTTDGTTHLIYTLRPGVVQNSPQYYPLYLYYYSRSWDAIMGKAVEWGQMFLDNWMAIFNAPSFYRTCTLMEQVGPITCPSYSSGGISCTAPLRERTGCETPWVDAIYAPSFNYVHQALDPAKSAGCSKSCGIGNPINADTGNKYQAEIDYPATDSLPGFTRYYNSKQTRWTHNDQRAVSLDSTGIQAGVLRSDGKTYTFILTNGNWVGDADVADKLVQTSSGWIYSLQNGRVESYDIQGRLLSDSDTTGKTTTYGYNTAGQLTTVTGPFGHRLTLGYDTVGRLSTLTDPTGQVTRYAYDSNLAWANLIKVIYPDGTAKLYHYDAPPYLTGISFVDTAGTATRLSTYGYDGSANAILTQHTQTDNATPQEKFTLQYDVPGLNQTTVTDAAGTQEVMTFAVNLGMKNLVSKQNLTDNKVLTQSFDAHNNLTCKQDEEGHVSTAVYNPTNQKTSMTDGLTGPCPTGTPTAATRTTTYQYLSPTLDLPTVIESPSVAGGTLKKRTTLGYTDTRFPTLPTSITQSGYTPAGAPVTRTVTLGYNTHGQVNTINGPRAPSDPGMAGVDDVTTLVYNPCTTGGACGQLQSVTNALGQTTTYDVYYADGRLQQKTDPNGLLSYYTYDPRGRVASIVQNPGTGSYNYRSFTYTPDGQVKTLYRYPDNLTYTYGYDAAQNLRSITDTIGNRVTYTYDVKGNRTSTVTQNADGTPAQSLVQAYDLRNHVASINHGGNLTTRVNDALGNRVSEIDPNHTAVASTAATVQAYDALNRLFQATDLLNGITQYAYDINDRVKQVTAPNVVVTAYGYDDLGNLLQEVSPDRGTTTYTYDAAGNVTTQLDARNVLVSYTYDALNRLTFADYPGTAKDTTYVYDTAPGCTYGIGRLCGTSVNGLTFSYAYDAFGYPSDKTETLSGTSYTTHTDHDLWGRITGITYPGGRQITYVRSARGFTNSITATVNGVPVTLVSHRVFCGDGLLARQTFGNGLVDSRLYTTAGRLYNQFLGTADTRVYSYDYNGNLTGKQTLPEVASYGYDPLNELTGDNDPTPLSFTYDANGNRKTGAGIPYTYTLNTNRLATRNGTAITLSPTGNVTNDPATNRTYNYNNVNELSSVYQSGGLIAIYGYDPQHLRISKMSAAGYTLFHYDAAGHLLQETDAAGTTQRAYVWADDTPIAQITPTSTGEVLTYLHTDYLDTPRLATDPTGKVVWRWEGNAFGDTAPNEDPTNSGVKTTVNLRYAGQYYDRETGLHYNWHRYYDPRLGRYITSDPIGLGGGLNTYAYVGNNPLRFTDSRGEGIDLNKAGRILILLGRLIMGGSGGEPPPPPIRRPTTIEQPGEVPLPPEPTLQPVPLEPLVPPESPVPPNKIWPLDQNGPSAPPKSPWPLDPNGPLTPPPGMCM